MTDYMKKAARSAAEEVERRFHEALRAGEIMAEEISGAVIADNRIHHERNERKIRRVLIVGIPRSGTTWVANALAGCRECVFVDEPDDERRWKITFDAKRNLGRYPIIAPGDAGSVGGYDISAYEYMWHSAWSIANEFTPRTIVLKSALIPYCLEWVVDRFYVDAVCWVDRFPLNTMASWVEYAKAAHPNVPLFQTVQRMCWQYGMLYQTYTRLQQQGYITVRVQHEELCADFDMFQGLADSLGLEWTYRSAEWLNDMNKGGEGGHWGLEEYRRDEHLNRMADEQDKYRYRQRINEQEVEMLLKHLLRWKEVEETLAQEALRRW